MKTYLLIAAVLIMAGVSPLQASQTLLLRQPALSADHLAFVYAGDIWIAERDGANPRRLTSSPAEESHPMFSPDGRSIAFAGEYDGNRDVHVIDVAGGQPRRLTWHPGADTPLDWTPDGKGVAFVSARETDHGRSGQLYHVGAEGGFPRRQMEARVYRGAYSDGGQFAYIPFGSGYNGLFGGSSGWKGYRGGTTPAIWIMDADRRSFVEVPGSGATNFNPVWLGASLYFLSDRDADRFNLFRYDATSSVVERVTDEPTWDIRSAAGEGSTIVYEAGGRIKSLDLNSGTTRELVIEISPDLPQLRPGWRSAASTIQSAGISRSGKRAVVTARGEVFTIPVKDGSTRNLSRSGTVREYTALWSPDGQQLAWIAESDGGQEVVVSDQSGREIARHELGKHFYFLTDWTVGEAPRLIYLDNHLGIHALDLRSGQSTAIATSARRDSIETAVSPDGRWVALTLEQPNFHRDLVLYNFETGNSMTVTDGMADVAAPAFSPDGKYLFFAASTNSGPIQVGLNMTSQERPYRAALYALVLAADGKSPLEPGTGDEEPDDKEGADDKKQGKGDKNDEDTDSQEPTRVDFEGLADRTVALPVAENNYGNLGVGKDGSLFYVRYVQPGASTPAPGSSASAGNRLFRFDFEKKEQKSVLGAVSSFSISSDGAHMIIGKSDGKLMTAEIGDDIKPKALELSGLKIFVDPREEWVQIFNETWRMEKEYFYADNLHGLDWQAVYRQYRPLVDHVGRREDLNTLLVEMIAEMQAGHNRVGGGDVYSANGPATGLLGANLEIDRGRYRLARVYRGESWNPFIPAPLATPGNEAADGEYILAVNGVDLSSEDNIYSRLEGTVGQQVTLRVGSRADGNDARDIVVKPIDSEYTLRLWRWIESNRRAVDEATGGRVGYIYLPNTAGAGYTFFNRMFFAQVDKEALIVDERSNGGGQAANYIIEVLGRQHLSGWADRDGLIYNTPAGAVHGPKVMLIDQDAGSGGDYLPHTFRYAGIGKLIGTRTWGGLIGISANPSLMDGGFLTVPFFRFFDPEGNWSVENEGVAPDIEVRLDPIATNAGTDTQLEAAVEEILRQLDGFDSGVMDSAPPLPTELGE